MKECPDCLHGWRRDVPPYGDDEPCDTCDETGYVKDDQTYVHESTTSWQIPRRRRRGR